MFTILSIRIYTAKKNIHNTLYYSHKVCKKLVWKHALFWYRSRSAFVKSWYSGALFESWGAGAKRVLYFPRSSATSESKQMCFHVLAFLYKNHKGRIDQKRWKTTSVWVIQLHYTKMYPLFSRNPLFDSAQWGPCCMCRNLFFVFCFFFHSDMELTFPFLPVFNLP